MALQGKAHEDREGRNRTRKREYDVKARVLSFTGLSDGESARPSADCDVSPLLWGSETRYLRLYYLPLLDVSNTYRNINF